MPASSPHHENASHSSALASIRTLRVVLTGFMGAGKSTVGRLLAQRIGWEFLDLDTHIEVTTGKSARELFADLGDERFRALESELWAETLQRSRVIVAPGGAVIDRDENQQALSKSMGSFVVFLDGAFEV